MAGTFFIVKVYCFIHVRSFVKSMYECIVLSLDQNRTFNEVEILVTRVIAIKNTFSFTRWYVFSSTGFYWQSI